MRFGSGDPRAFTGLNATFLLFKLSDGTNVTSPGITEVPSATGLYYFNWGTTTSISFLADAATTSPGADGRYVAGSLDPSDRIDEYGTTLVAIGMTNFALGTTNVALGTTNVALGTTNVALGNSNIALGNSNIALGNTNIAFGTTNVALGTSNFALGTSNLAIAVSIYALSTSLYALGLSIQFSVGTTASSFGSTSIDPTDLFGYLKRIIENLEGNQTFIKVSGELDIFSRGSSTLLRVKTVTNSVSTVIKT